MNGVIFSRELGELLKNRLQLRHQFGRKQVWKTTRAGRTS
jgi:hypothetical protein